VSALVTPAAMVPFLERGEIVGMRFAGSFLLGYGGRLVEADDAEEALEALTNLSHDAWAYWGYHADVKWLLDDGRVVDVDADDEGLHLPEEVTGSC
jgi:hypothetical protein